MVKDFLIINFTGKKDTIGLRINNNFFVKKLDNNIRNKGLLVNNIFDFINEKNAKIDKNFSVIVNIGPGSFSGIRISLAVAKGIKIAKGNKMLFYETDDLDFGTKGKFHTKDNISKYNFSKEVNELYLDGIDYKKHQVNYKRVPMTNQY